jgi:hypothetical protein
MIIILSSSSIIISIIKLMCKSIMYGLVLKKVYIKRSQEVKQKGEGKKRTNLVKVCGG